MSGEHDIKLMCETLAASRSGYYQWLRSEKGGLLGSKIKWNFTKYLLGKDGQVIGRYSPTTKPEKIASDIEKALAA